MCYRNLVPTEIYMMITSVEFGINSGNILPAIMLFIWCLHKANDILCHLIYFKGYIATQYLCSDHLVDKAYFCDLRHFINLESLCSGHVIEKEDVYSYRVVLFDIVIGKRCILHHGTYGPFRKIVSCLFILIVIGIYTIVL